MIKKKILMLSAIASLLVVGTGACVAATTDAFGALANAPASENLTLTWKAGEKEIVSPGGWKIAVESDNNHVILKGSIQKINAMEVTYTTPEGKNPKYQALYHIDGAEHYYYNNEKPLTKNISFAQGSEPSAVNIWDADVSSIKFTYSCVNDGTNVLIEKGLFLVGNKQFTERVGNTEEFSILHAAKQTKCEYVDSQDKITIDLVKGDILRFRDENKFRTATCESKWDYAIQDGDNIIIQKTGTFTFYLKSSTKVYIAFTPAQ